MQRTLLLARELRRVCLGFSFGLYLNLRAFVSTSCWRSAPSFRLCLRLSRLCRDRLGGHVLFGFVLAVWRSAPSFRLRHLLRLLHLLHLLRSLPPASPCCAARSTPSFLITHGLDIGRTTKTTREAGRRCQVGQAEAHVPQGNRANEGHEVPVV